MRLRCNFRLYLEQAQCEALARAFGCAGVVFNDGLRARQHAHAEGLPYLSDVELFKRVTVAKATPERAWLAEVSSVVLQQALADLNMAYRNFFASVSGKRKGSKVAPPRFRSCKDDRQAIRFTKNARFAVLGNGRLRLPKIGDVPVRRSRRLPTAPSSVTVVKDAADRHFASFVIQAPDDPLPPTDSEVGIDLGLTHLAVLSDGTKVAAQKFLRRAARKLRRLQQALSRKTKGSNRRGKAVAKVARAHAGVADTRRDWQHELSTAIIRGAHRGSACCRSKPEQAGEVRTRHGLGIVHRPVGAQGRRFTRVDRFFPSTRLCSDCGRVNDTMTLDVRAWDCLCGSTHDRDINAAKNVLAAGRTTQTTVERGQDRQRCRHRATKR